MKIRIYYDNINYRFRGWRKAAGLIIKVIRSENRTLGDLNFIITNDETILKINKEFLNHNYFTDVIAFGECVEGKVYGEVYISKDTVKVNSVNYNVSLNDEMLRVLIHGTLHLTGYSDDTDEKKKIMHSLENYWIEEYKKI